jgi:hypothetical protein
MLQSISREVTLHSFAHPHGMKGALKPRSTLLNYVPAWTGPEYIQGIDNCIKIVEDVNPDVIVIELAFSQAIEACNCLQQEIMTLSPNPCRRIFLPSQQMLARFRKYPALVHLIIPLKSQGWSFSLGSGYPYPLPWYLISISIYLVFRAMRAFILST